MQYAGQHVDGSLETLKDEHPDPSLLFDNKTWRQAKQTLKSEPFEVNFDLLRHLHDVREANDSHMADFYIKAFEERAAENGRRVIDYVVDLPQGIVDEFYPEYPEQSTTE